jgi:hypothetical protein
VSAEKNPGHVPGFFCSFTIWPFAILSKASVGFCCPQSTVDGLKRPMAPSPMAVQHGYPLGKTYNAEVPQNSRSDTHPSGMDVPTHADMGLSFHKISLK